MKLPTRLTASLAQLQGYSQGTGIGGGARCRTTETQRDISPTREQGRLQAHTPSPMQEPLLGTPTQGCSCPPYAVPFSGSLLCYLHLACYVHTLCEILLGAIQKSFAPLSPTPDRLSFGFFLPGCQAPSSSPEESPRAKLVLALAGWELDLQVPSRWSRDSP